MDLIITNRKEVMGLIKPTTNLVWLNTLIEFKPNNKNFLIVISDKSQSYLLDISLPVLCDEASILDTITTSKQDIMTTLNTYNELSIKTVEFIIDEDFLVIWCGNTFG